MDQRLRYARLMPDGISKMTALEHHLKPSAPAEAPLACCLTKHHATNRFAASVDCR